MLDGEPFQTIRGRSCESQGEQEMLRNNWMDSTKQSDQLVSIVCSSLASSGKFNDTQLSSLSQVISGTLAHDPARRINNISQIISLLSADPLHQSRSRVQPSRLPPGDDSPLFTMEYMFDELNKTSPVLQSRIVAELHDMMSVDSEKVNHSAESDHSTAAFLLAQCLANGAGTAYNALGCLTWLERAAESGSRRATDILPNFRDAIRGYVPSEIGKYNAYGAVGSSSYRFTSHWESSEMIDFKGESYALAEDDDVKGKTKAALDLLHAAKNCEYSVIIKHLANNKRPDGRKDDMSPLHYLSSWDIAKAESLGQALISAGYNINAQAQNGPMPGGTPLMWSIVGDHIEHSAILLRLGADPELSTTDGTDALLLAAKLHLSSHLDLLLHSKTSFRVCENACRLMEAAIIGESQFTRIGRHGQSHLMVAWKTIDVLRKWIESAVDAEGFKKLLVASLESSFKSPLGRSNPDIKVSLITKYRIPPSDLTTSLREAIVHLDRKVVFFLLDYGVLSDLSHGLWEDLLRLTKGLPIHIFAADFLTYLFPHIDN